MKERTHRLGMKRTEKSRPLLDAFGPTREPPPQPTQGTAFDLFCTPVPTAVSYTLFVCGRGDAWS